MLASFSHVESTFPQELMPSIPALRPGSASEFTVTITLGKLCESALPKRTRPSQQTAISFYSTLRVEPARPLAERRHKQSPLKDVAGMIRSFSYAAYSGLGRYLASNPEIARTVQAENAEAWAVFWQNSISAAFLHAYRETVASNPMLLPTPQQSQSLLSAYLLEKALYELLYELNNRPTWLRIRSQAY